MSFKERVSASTAHIGDTALHNWKRSVRGARSSAAGGRAYKASFQNMKTTYARGLHDEKIGKRAFKDMHKAMVLVKQYDEKHLDKLHDRFANNPKRLDHEITKIAKRFSDDVSLFSEGLMNYLRSINDALVRSNQEFGTSNEMIIALVSQYLERIKKQGGYVPKKFIHEALKELKHLEKREFKYAKKESNADQALLEEDAAEESGNGSFHIFRVTWHRLKREMRSNEHQEITDLRENLQSMKNDLDGGHANLSFLPYLTHHLKNMERIAKLHVKICLDFLKMISNADTYYHEMKQSIARFQAMFATYGSTKHLQREIDKLNQDHESIKKAIQADMQTQKQEYHISKAVSKQVKHLLKELSSISDENVRRRVQSAA